MRLFLNFGAGSNQLPEPWQNLNAEHDIRKRLKFDDASASRILAEHVIEHVPYLQGFGFLQECKRVLEPGGVLRLAFPDPVRLLAIAIDTEAKAPAFTLGVKCSDYAAALARRSQGELVRRAYADERPRAAALALLVGFNHQSVWSQYSAAAALCAVGFRRVVSREYGRGEIAGVDGHHLEVGEEVAFLETSVLEATK